MLDLQKLDKAVFDVDMRALATNNSKVLTPEDSQCALSACGGPAVSAAEEFWLTGFPQPQLSGFPPPEY